MTFELTDQGQRHFEALCVFSKHMLLSQDIDPLYPILSYLQRDMDEETALWHSFLYVAWYNLPSATVAFGKCPEPSYEILSEVEAAWSTGVERRNHRGGNVTRHLASYLDTLDEIESQREFYLDGIPFPDGAKLHQRHENWEVINKNIRKLYGNGRWAGYKHCEVLRRVNDLPLEAPDAGHQFSSGPREGLHMLYGHIEGEGKEAIATLDEMTLDLQQRFADQGLNMDIEYVETILCNYKSLAKGKYYVGHDIDELQHQIEKSFNRGFLTDEQRAKLYEARRETLPEQYLGERNDWSGVDKKRAKHFKRSGKIALRGGKR